jgi:hypothetical protein
MTAQVASTLVRLEIQVFLAICETDEPGSIG